MTHRTPPRAASEVQAPGRSSSLNGTQQPGRSRAVTCSCEMFRRTSAAAVTGRLRASAARMPRRETRRAACESRGTQAKIAQAASCASARPRSSGSPCAADFPRRHGRLMLPSEERSLAIRRHLSTQARAYFAKQRRQEFLVDLMLIAEHHTHKAIPREVHGSRWLYSIPPGLVRPIAGTTRPAPRRDGGHPDNEGKLVRLPGNATASSSPSARISTIIRSIAAARPASHAPANTRAPSSAWAAAI